MYSHRNGETDSPTINGRFWVRNVDNDDDDEATIVFVWLPDVYQFGDEWPYKIAEYEGNTRWWGPLIPPSP